MTKTYTPTEVAIQVLKKTAELMQDLKKTNTAHEVEMGQDPAAGSVTPGQDKSNGQPQGQSQGSSQSQPSQSSGEAPKKKKKLNPDGTESDEYEERELLDEHNESKHNEPKNENSAFKGASPAAQQEKNQEQTSAGQKPTEAQKPQQNEQQGEKPKAKTNFPSFGKSEDMKKAHSDRMEVGQRGVHQTFDKQKGVSTRGQKIRDAKKDPSDAKNLIPSAKSNSKHVIAEQKAMKKPNLPKSEECGADQDVKNIKIKSTKLKSFLEKKMAKREGI